MPRSSAAIGIFTFDYLKQQFNIVPSQICYMLMVRTKHNEEEIFFKRIEPKILKQSGSSYSEEYINLRTCVDIHILGTLENELSVSGIEDPVIVPWISPPYGIVRGYGIYSREDAKSLSKQAEDEHWVLQFGRIYDLDWIINKIK